MARRTKYCDFKGNHYFWANDIGPAENEKV